MKHVLLISIILTTLQGCDAIGLPADSAGGITTTFSLFDTTGRVTTQFRPGEPFDMRFTLTNASGRDQVYHFTGVELFFEIDSGNTVFSTSIDGMIFPQVVLTRAVHNGETFHGSWRAPRSIMDWPPLRLQPGSYQAFVRHHAFFDTLRIVQTGPIPFTIVP